VRMFGRGLTFEGGLKVYTTIDSEMQSKAEHIIEHGLTVLERKKTLQATSRAAYLKHNAVGQAPPAVSDSPPYLQGALLSMDAKTGAIYAIVGGRNFNESKFNRAVSAERQSGSAFKPFLYAAALESGMNPSSTIDASALELTTAQGPYIAANSEDRDYGTVTLQTALAKSINTAAIRLGQLIGLDRLIDSARRFQIDGLLPRVVSLPLGPGNVTLFEMVCAYSAFPNGGLTSTPHIIDRVEGSDGAVLYRSKPKHHVATDPAVAFLMTTMLEDAVDNGTGSGVRAAGYRGPVAGKTGTTNGCNDAWFLGFTPSVVTGVWVGFDAPRQIAPGAYGGTIAVPIWTEFMKAAFPKPSGDFVMPEGVVRVPICLVSGEAANPACYFQLAGGETPSNVQAEYFLEGNAPPSCHIHSMSAFRQFAATDANGEPAAPATGLLHQP